MMSLGARREGKGVVGPAMCRTANDDCAINLPTCSTSACEYCFAQELPLDEGQGTDEGKATTSPAGQ